MSETTTKLRVNRPETAAKVLSELSRQARGLSLLFFVLGASMGITALWDYGVVVRLMGAILTAIGSIFVYLVALHILVDAWHGIQFYRPTPPKRLRQVPLKTREGTRFIDVADRGGG